MDRILTYDSTLRDGEQCEGITLSLEDKLRIVERLDAFGIGLHRGGIPRVKPQGHRVFPARANAARSNMPALRRSAPRARRAWRPRRIKGLRTLWPAGRGGHHRRQDVGCAGHARASDHA